MKQRHNPSITKMFAGFRMIRKRVGEKMDSVPVRPEITLTKNLFKQLEKLTVLTPLQGNLVKERLEKCTVTKKYKVINDEGKEEDKDIVEIVASPQHIARLSALLEKVIEEEK